MAIGASPCTTKEDFDVFKITKLAFKEFVIDTLLARKSELRGLCIIDVYDRLGSADVRARVNTAVNDAVNDVLNSEVNDVLNSELDRVLNKE